MIILSFVEPKLEAGAGLVMKGGLKSLQIYVSPLVISLQPLMCPSLLRLNQVFLSEVGVVAGAQEERKHTQNDPICSELDWKCIPLVVETFGAWGRTAGHFSELAVRLAAQVNSTQDTMHAKFCLRQAKSTPMHVLSSPVPNTKWTCLRWLCAYYILCTV